jgi:hypothetical protein
MEGRGWLVDAEERPGIFIDLTVIYVLKCRIETV